MRTRHMMLLTTLLTLALATASAAADPERICQKGRYYAAAKYAQCEQQQLVKNYYFGWPLYPKVARCQKKYTATWPKLQAQSSGTGSTCDNPRFEDNGDGTVTDRLTALQWEKKTDDATTHNKDYYYTWSEHGEAANGAVFTSFLATLNSDGCFAGQCDWRLPTVQELQTILQAMAPDPCTTYGCVDAVFGPPQASNYWSSNTFMGIPGIPWIVNFYDGVVSDWSSIGVGYVRAVRGGL